MVESNRTIQPWLGRRIEPCNPKTRLDTEGMRNQRIQATEAQLQNGREQVDDVNYLVPWLFTVDPPSPFFQVLPLIARLCS